MTKEEISNRIPELIDAGIDFTQFGWLGKSLEIINCDYRTLQKTLETCYPEIWKICFKRKKPSQPVIKRHHYNGVLDKDSILQYLQEHPTASKQELSKHFDVNYNAVNKFLKDNDITLNPMYTCECGRKFENQSGYGAHCSYCKAHLKREPRKPFDGHQGWSKGITKNDPRYESAKRSWKSLQTKESIEKRVRTYKRTYNNKSQEELDRQYQKQSISRKQGYKTGKIKVPTICSPRGRGCFIIYHGEKIWLRSTYEFIFACFLKLLDIDFSYESVRASDEEKTYICDFVIDKHVFEIKGLYEQQYVDKYINAFRQLGYTVSLINSNKIKCIKQYLGCIFDINNLTNKIRQFNRLKTPLTIDLDNCFITKI